MHQPKALDDVLSMFGSNKLRQALFIGKMWVSTSLVPPIRKAARLPLKQELIT